MKLVIALLTVLVGASAFADRTEQPLLVATKGVNYKCEIFSNRVRLSVTRVMPQERPLHVNLETLNQDIYDAAQASRNPGNYSRAIHMTATNPPAIQYANYSSGGGNALVQIILYKDASDVRTLKGAAAQRLRMMLKTACGNDTEAGGR